MDCYMSTHPFNRGCGARYMWLSSGRRPHHKPRPQLVWTSSNPFLGSRFLPLTPTYGLTPGFSLPPKSPNPQPYQALPAHSAPKASIPPTICTAASFSAAQFW